MPDCVTAKRQRNTLLFFALLFVCVCVCVCVCVHVCVCACYTGSNSKQEKISTRQWAENNDYNVEKLFHKVLVCPSTVQ